MNASALWWALLLLVPAFACVSVRGALCITAALVLVLMRRMFRWYASLQPTTRCPAGHVVDQYGRFRCTACGAVSDGWLWNACVVCGQSCGWIACSVCGLATKNPGA